MVSKSVMMTQSSADEINGISEDIVITVNYTFGVEGENPKLEISTIKEP